MTLIERMARENADWGYRRLPGDMPPVDLDPNMLLLALIAAAAAPLTLQETGRQLTGEDPSTTEFAEKDAERLGRLVRYLSANG